MTTLFQTGTFTLHSGATSNFKIDCDALSDEDIETLAWMIASCFRFSAVEGVPTGGLRLAAALQKFRSSGRFIGEPELPLLIVDDVLTTGASMEEQRAGRQAVGAVLWARDRRRCPQWVQPMFIGPLLVNEFATITPDPRPNPRRARGFERTA